MSGPYERKEVSVTAQSQKKNFFAKRRDMVSWSLFSLLFLLAVACHTQDCFPTIPFFSKLALALSLFMSNKVAPEPMIGDQSSPKLNSSKKSWSMQLRTKTTPSVNKKGRNKSSWNFFAWLKGSPLGQYFMLLITGIVLLFGGAFAWMGTDGNEGHTNSFTQAFWLSWGLFFDPGTQTGLGARSSPLPIHLFPTAKNPFSIARARPTNLLQFSFQSWASFLI